MVVVALFFLPRFLRAGIFTMPEYLEYRYDAGARSIMALFMMLAYIFVALATVLYSGALALEAVIGLPLIRGIWIIGALSGAYVTYGGLRAVVWTELIQGTALLLGALLVFVLSLHAIGGWGQFTALSAGKLHTVLPWNDPEMPWLAVFFGGSGSRTPSTGDSTSSSPSGRWRHGASPRGSGGHSSRRPSKSRSRSSSSCPGSWPSSSFPSSSRPPTKPTRS